MINLGDFYGFSVENVSFESFFYGFSTENQENLIINFVDQDNNPVSNVDITFKNTNYTTDNNGQIELYSDTTTNEILLSQKDSGFIGENYFFYETIETLVNVTDSSIIQYITVVMQVLVVEANLTIKAVNKSFEEIPDITLNIVYNSLFNENLITNSKGEVGPLIIVPILSEIVSVNFEGNSLYKNSFLQYLKTDVDKKETIYFILEEQPETIRYIETVKNYLFYINLNKIFKLNILGKSCQNLMQVSCDLFSYLKEIERLDIDNNYADLLYFNNIKFKIDKLISEIDIQKIKNINYFNYDLSSICIKEVTTSSIELSWIGTLENNVDYFIIERSLDNISFEQIGTSLLPLYKDENLSINTRYYYRISSKEGTKILTINDSTLHLPITSVSILETTENSISLDWVNLNLEGTGYEIYLSTDNNTFFLEESIEDINLTSYTIENLQESILYYLKIRIIDTVNNSISPYLETQAITKLITPTDLISTVDSNTITLNWIDNSQKELTYILGQSLDNINFVDLELDINRNTQTIKIENLQEETEYFFNVRAKSNIAESLVSNTSSQITTIAIPLNLILEPVSNTQINIGWEDTSNIEDGFILERSLDGINFIEIANLPANTIIFSDLNLGEGTMYFYRIKSFNVNYESAYSTIESACTMSQNQNLD